MRIGLVSDIHANRVALAAVLDDMPAVDDLVCVGDVVGYNPWPGECIDIVRERCSATVEGNHDRNVDTPGRYAANRMAQAGLEHAQRILDEDEREWLRSLPRRVELADGRVLLVHDHPETRDRYVYPGQFPGLAHYFEDGEFGGYAAIVLGHTHVQGVEQLAEGLVCNPGSVGQPRDSDPRAAYAVLDTDGMAVDLHRVEYDIQAVQDEIRRVGLPEGTGTRLAEGR